jgi:prolipoprotein diacylglyceryltransferase
MMLIGIFTARFFIEYVKENQVAFESGLLLNMGQMLSIPFIIAGILFYTGKVAEWFPQLIQVQEAAVPSDVKPKKKRKKAKGQ